MDATSKYNFGSSGPVKTKIDYYNCKLNNSKINESEREKFAKKLAVAKLTLRFFQGNIPALKTALLVFTPTIRVQVLQAVRNTISPAAKKEIKLVASELQNATASVAVERLAAQEKQAAAAQAAAAEAAVAPIQKCFRAHTQRKVAKEAEIAKILEDLKELNREEALALNSQYTKEALETLDQLSELDTTEERALEDIANSKSAMEEIVALREIFQYIIDTRSFIYTSGSAKLLKPDNSNKSGVAILGVIEAIGRAILLPFVAIAQCFICLAEGRKVNMRPYIDTFSAPFNPQEN